MGELFIEVLCEELPARFIEPGQQALAKNIVKMLTGLEHGPVQSWSTPRRLAVAVADVATQTAKEEKQVTGPPEAAAFRDGVPTKAAIGFARGKGISVEDLTVIDTPRGRVVAAMVTSGGQTAHEIVSAGLANAIMGVQFPKTMRWGDGTHGWGRPIHKVTALLDGQTLSITVAGIASGSQTVGHRHTPGPISVTGSQQWVDDLRAHHVEADPSKRRASIEQQLTDHANRLNTNVTPSLGLVDEVVNLVEWPVVVSATFPQSLLDLPPRLLVESMGVHQRVFPLYTRSEDETNPGRLSHHFLVVTNHTKGHEPDVATIIGDGNRRVLQARFHDAQFFYAEDKKIPLADHGKSLGDMRWIRDGGTMADKSQRVAALSKALAAIFECNPEEAQHAGALCKADLMTLMVGEFPELQGHVGRLLASHEGLGNAVATAIEEHYLPRFTGDELPCSPQGRSVALADRLDTLAGCFAKGLRPKGSADPLGLRRASNGLIAILLDAQIQTPLPELFGLTEWELDSCSDALLQFVVTRLRTHMCENHPTDVVDAVLGTGDLNVVALSARVQALSAIATTAEFGPLKETFKRVMGLTKEHLQTDYAANKLAHPSEKALHDALDNVADRAQQAADNLDFATSLAELSSLKGPVDQLFEDVMVMDDDLEIRRNRLGLLRSVADAFRHIADFTRLST